MLKTNAIKLAVAAVVAWCSVASAEWTDVPNPNSGISLSPTVIYDPATGLLSVDNDGANMMSDSADNSTLGGDDTGMISLLVSYNGSDVAGVLPVFADGIAWSAPQVFNGKIQLSGNAIAASFLPVASEPVPVAQLPMGLSLADFQTAAGTVELEMGVNFNFGAPGGTLFDTDAATSGNFVVPEPASISLLVSALLAGLGLIRRR